MNRNIVKLSSIGLLTTYGVVDYFDLFNFISGDKPINKVPDDYYSTSTLADTAVVYVDKHTDSNKPFFM